ATKLSGIFTDDAVIIDEVTPFRWTGANAGIAWWQHVEKSLPPHSKLQATASAPSQFNFDREQDDAYMIQPLTINVTSRGKSRVELGMQTYTFHKANGTWKISSATWTTKPK